jgi:hypothetical protein
MDAPIMGEVSAAALSTVVLAEKMNKSKYIVDFDD